ncbi:MAG TPA: hypothetical protein VLG15_15765 [Thermoanaerobaculia bacterium]|nr:hypothetical protein [Thermoanaerobaculia bacterium]
MIASAVLIVSSLASNAAGPPASPVKPTFCVEWVRQSREGYERITLFADATVIWKTVDSAGDRLRRKTLAPEELEFYCSYFARPEVWSVADDLRTGLTGEFSSQSSITVTRKDGAVKKVRYDEFSPLTAESAALRSALEGLRGIFTNPLAPASRFTADALPAGTLLKRFDGAMFRVLRIDREKGVVEIAGVNEPYSQFVKIEELRFQFSPPE